MSTSISPPVRGATRSSCQERRSRSRRRRRSWRREPAPDRPGPALIHVLCAPNAFKGTLTAFEAAAAMAQGVREAGVSAGERPVADGGDGTLDVLMAAAGPRAHIATMEVTGPLGAKTQARLGWLTQGDAMVEMAEASGLRKLSGRPDAVHATSYGAGELIVAALGSGARRVVIGVGGSATTDGGAGLLQALGARLLDARGHELARGGGALVDLARIDLSGLHPQLGHCRLDVAADVRSPLCGEDGAARVFGPQKGASPSEVELLAQGLARLADVAERDLGAAGLAQRPGTGAAGGCAYGLALLGAELRDGAALVCDEVGLDRVLDGASLVITGEGRLDAQTAVGKAPSEVAVRARAHGVPCIAIAGSVDDPLAGVFDAVYSLTDLARGEDPRRNAPDLLRRAAQLAMSEMRVRVQ